MLAAVDMLALTRKYIYKLIVADLVSVYEGRGHGYGMPNPGDDVRACCEWIYNDLKRFRKLVLRARAAAAVSHNSIVTIADAWHSDLMDQCDAHQFPGAVAAVEDRPDADRFSYKCWCGHLANSFTTLVVHSTHRHGFRKPDYAYLNDEGYCPGCLRTYHTFFDCWGICRGRLLCRAWLA